CTQHQHGLTRKRKNHPVCPRLGEPNDIAANQTRANTLPHHHSGKPSVVLLFCHGDAKWPNEKAQVRPPRARETKPPRANWHGSKASPAAIWLGGDGLI